MCAKRLRRSKLRTMTSGPPVSARLPIATWRRPRLLKQLTPRRRARCMLKRGGVRLLERKRAREGTDRDQEGWRDHREFDDGADHDRRRRGLQRYDRNRPERGGAGGEECRLAGSGGWRSLSQAAFWNLSLAM